MKPIFLEEHNILSKFGLEAPIKKMEYLFMDRNIIFGFTKENKKIKIARIKNISEKGITISHYNTKIDYDEIITCICYYESICNVEDSIFKSLGVLNDTIKKYPNHKLIVMNSTGKDSMCAQLVINKSKISHETVFANTTLDCHQTYQMVKKLNYTVISPNIGFYNWVKEDIIPTRSIRKCCDIFKEGQCADYFDDNSNIIFVTGMRNDESENRKNYPYIMENSKWNTNQKSNWKLLNIIKDWSEDTVWLSVLKNIIEVNPLYLLGYNRVGCVVACPYQKDYVIFLDKINLPTYYENWRKILKEKFIEDRLWCRLNCTIEEYLFKHWKEGMKYRENPTEEVIEEFCKYTNKSKENALKYFKNTCKNKCVTTRGTEVALKSDIIALNMKLLGRYMNKGDMYCEKCLSNILGITKKEIKQSIKEFKKQGCNLF